MPMTQYSQYKEHAESKYWFSITTWFATSLGLVLGPAMRRY